MATLSCKSHWWHKPSCVLKCFVTFLTPESNFSRGRLSQRYVPTNPYRSGSKGWHSCPLRLRFPLKVWSQGKLEPVSFGDSIQLYLEWRKTHVCDLIQADRARGCATSPQGLVPRAILDANFCFKCVYKDSYSTHKNRDRLKPRWPSYRQKADGPPFLPVFQVRQYESGPLYLTLWDPKSLSIWHLS